MQVRLGVMSLLLVIVGCVGEDALWMENETGADPASMGLRQIAQTYKSLHRMTSEPVFVTEASPACCFGESLDDAVRSRARGEPLRHEFFEIFMNRLASHSFSLGRPYPVGSVLVKERVGLSKPFEGANNQGSKSVWVGGMVKRKSGYDPDNGDWEYFYFRDPKNVQTDNLTTCIECHQKAETTDFVFGGWKPVAPELKNAAERGY